MHQCGEIKVGTHQAIEVWNEMNIDFEWPKGQISPSAYVNNMLAPAYNASAEKANAESGDGASLLRPKGEPWRRPAPCRAVQADRSAGPAKRPERGQARAPAPRSPV